MARRTDTDKFSIATRYDADKEVLYFNIAHGGVSGSANESYDDQWRWKGFDPFTWNRYHSNSPLMNLYSEGPGKYLGKNAFGQGKEVHVGSNEQVALFYMAKMYEIKVPIKASEAQKLKDDVKVIFSVRFSPPCFFSGTKHTTPTMTYPYELNTKVYGLLASSVEWIVVRASTGVVLKRGPLN